MSFLSSLLVCVCVPQIMRLSSPLVALSLSLSMITCAFPSMQMSMFPATYLHLSLWSWDLSALSLLVIFYMSVVDSALFGQQSKVFLSGLYMALSSILLIFFQTTYVICFFIFFEVSALIIFFMIILSGYQPERLRASMALLIYTSVGAVPLLFGLVLSVISWNSNDFLVRLSLSAQASEVPGTYVVFMGLVMMAFLIKFPIYGVHYWLPKAHVEASGSGSMLLAGVLLKMGGHGIFLVGQCVTPLAGSLIASWALWGGALISVACMWQTDFKILIAYSSVAHMALVIAALLVNSASGQLVALLVMLSHGFSSAFMFYMSSIFFHWTSSRQMAINAGGLTLVPAMAAFWFMGNAVSMGTPPFFNFWGELLGVISLSEFSQWCMYPLSVMLWVTVAYSLILYGATQTGQKATSVKAPWTLSASEIMVSGMQVLVLVLAVPSLSVCV